MKTRLIIFLFIASIGQTIAQRLQLISPDAYNGIYVPVERALNYNNIEGSPYLDDDLLKGYVKFSFGDSTVQYVRYNIYSDEMEYLDGEKLYVIENVNSLDHVHVNGHFLFYRTYKLRNSFREGYLDRLVEGRYNLYLKYNVDFEEAKPARSSYHEPTPNRFVMKNPTWYCSIDNSVIKNFETDNSSLEEIFREDFAEMKKYIKAEKLKLRKQEDVVRLFEYYNSMK